MDIITEVLPYIGSGLSLVNIVILLQLKYFQKDLERDAQKLKELEENINKRIRRIEFFLDKRFSFSSLPDGYK